MWLVVALLALSGAHAQTLLTLGSPPNSSVSHTIGPGELSVFYIDLVTDYCNDAAVQARGACGTPKAVVRLECCSGEAWLYANPTTSGVPSTSVYDLRSNNGSATGYIEELQFDLSQTSTYIAVYGVTNASFQIWASDINFNVSTVPRALPSGDGTLTRTITLSGSVFTPSTVTVNWNTGYISNYSSESITYSLYYLRISDPPGNYSDITQASYSMSTACAIAAQGTLVSTGSGTTGQFSMAQNGGLYVVAVQANTASGWQGSWKSLGFLFTAYETPDITSDTNWDLIVVIVVPTTLFCLLTTLCFLYFMKRKIDKREHSKRLLKEQLERKSLMAEGKTYEFAKKRRALSCWERLTGEIVTAEDEVYGEDGLTVQERKILSAFETAELGGAGVPEPEPGRRPSQVVPMV